MITLQKPSVSDLKVELEPSAQLAVLARALHRDGYDEHNNGHISWRQADNSLLVTPYGLAWDEVRASDIVRVSLDGQILAGNRGISPALMLHLVLHRERDIDIAVHQHPQWSTVWACTGRVPPIYDQTSAYLGGPLKLIQEYAGEVFDEQAALETVAAFAGTSSALLANHGVLVTGDSIRQVHQRAVALEWRCRLAWRVEALGTGQAPLDEVQVAQLEASINRRGGYLPTLFDAMARREIRSDASVLD